MEIIGKGNHAKGAVWVARKIPDGYVSAHANQARITTFPLSDPSTCVYSPDVISFARDIGLYPENALDEMFSFSDVYDAVTFSGARYVLCCVIHMWMYNHYCCDKQTNKQYDIRYLVTHTSCYGTMKEYSTLDHPTPPCSIDSAMLVCGHSLGTSWARTGLISMKTMLWGII